MLHRSVISNVICKVHFLQKTSWPLPGAQNWPISCWWQITFDPENNNQGSILSWVRLPSTENALISELTPGCVRSWSITCLLELCVLCSPNLWSPIFIAVKLLMQETMSGHHTSVRVLPTVAPLPLRMLIQRLLLLIFSQSQAEYLDFSICCITFLDQLSQFSHFHFLENVHTYIF